MAKVPKVIYMESNTYKIPEGWFSDVNIGRVTGDGEFVRQLNPNEYKIKGHTVIVDEKYLPCVLKYTRKVRDFDFSGKPILDQIPIRVDKCGRVLSSAESLYLEKWNGYTEEQLRAEKEKWFEFAWLGRHLFLAHIGDVTKEKYPEAFEAQERIIRTYRNDRDFIHCFINPDSERGDKEWKEIMWNLGSLRFLLYGEWDLDT